MAAYTNSSKVGIVFTPRLLQLCDKNPKFTKRGTLVHGLIAAYKLTKRLTCIRSTEATQEDLQLFHSTNYISFLKKMNKADCYEEAASQIELEDYGLGYDCPIFEGVYDYCCNVTGASLSAAEALMSERFSLVFNWFGGWHHAKRGSAAGFCYCNDIVVAVLKLLTKYKQVLYIDMDVHHGDGVEEAFFYSEKVMTVSFHRHSPGFYPGSGDISAVGKGRGSYYNVNVPLKVGIDDEQYVPLFQKCLSLVFSVFGADVIVLQCGVDTLVEDPMESFCLTSKGIGECFQFLLQKEIPMLVLGGGGYNFPATAKCWTYLTSLALKESLDNEIPEHEYYEEYCPECALHSELPVLRRKNTNTQKEMDGIVEIIRGNLLNIEVEGTHRASCSAEKQDTIP